MDSVLADPRLADPRPVEPSPAASMTLEEWADLPEDEEGELVDGQLVEEEMGSPVHELIVMWLAQLLYGWVRPRGGIVFGSESKYAVKARRGRKPDLSLYLPGSVRPARLGVIRVTPDILIEVVSPSPRDIRRDRIEKLNDYAAFGVRWYWIVDPQVRTFEIFELGADRRYARALGVSEGAIEAVPGCEGLTLDVDALWAEADELGPAEPEPPAEEEGE